MPALALTDGNQPVYDWSPAGSALRSAKPRWIREMAWSPLVAPPAVRHGGTSSGGPTPTPRAAARATKKTKKDFQIGFGRRVKDDSSRDATEKDGPSVGQYHVAVDCVLPRAPTARICEPVGGSRLAPGGSQTARPASAPSHNSYDEEPVTARMIESVRGKTPEPDFGRSTPRPDNKRESFWEVMQEQDVTKLSTQKRSVGHQFGKASRQPPKVGEGASWPPNVSYKHCSNETRTKGVVAFDKQSQRFRDMQLPQGTVPVRVCPKGFWERVQGNMRHERCASHDDDHATRRRPKSVMDMSKTTGRPLLTPEPKDSATGRNSTSPDAQGSGILASTLDMNAVPHLPEDPAKPSQTWYQFTGRAPSPKGASRSATPGGRKAASLQRENKGFAHEWALEECRRITEWFEWRHSKNQEQTMDIDPRAASPTRFL